MTVIFVKGICQGKPDLVLFPNDKVCLPSAMDFLLFSLRMCVLEYVTHQGRSYIFIKKRNWQVDPNAYLLT